jgi:hypothetical protein
MRVEHIRTQFLQGDLYWTACIQMKPWELSRTNHACPESFHLGGQGTWALKAQDRHTLAKTLSLAHKIHNNAFESAHI